ncbi:Crp/Fnr family transcriptional regulator [Micromonospora craniellae]|uniref:Crp/Fnr family transcriptional regulator n=1 Tax=Micromonospora craniellae TaxID=2294034 RepID=A0A372FZ35_9ACTN|nr:Crp/Fnr family transcriptional regulator [Micromonospora craniellae]QOC93437.1 Crp/Fnr family transcriptional regulator [Micromonospora craniellae]RFS45884.1 Crp/Fnr family transcriptional regulator [Micromonospora craniellae]
MAELLLTGDWNNDPRTLIDLLQHGHALAPIGPLPRESPTLLVAAVQDPGTVDEAARTARDHGLPWMALDCTSDASCTASAYEQGALAVIHRQQPGTPLADAVRNTLTLLVEARAEPTGPETAGNSLTRHRAGQRLTMQHGEVLEVIEGVVITRALHSDGTESLLDWAEPGRLLLAHPPDQCHLERVAQTDTVVRRHESADLARDDTYVQRLSHHIVEREAWSAMQARPHVEDRILGLLTLLAERFGVGDPRGVLISLHLTHAQIAAATGCTRPTASRLIQRLVRAGPIAVIGSGSRTRFLLVSGPSSRDGGREIPQTDADVCAIAHRRTV